MEIEIRGLEDIKKYLEAMPNEAESVLRTSVNKALKTAHREALIQISRRYTISMQGVEKEFKEIQAIRTVSTPQMLGNKDVSEKVTEVTKAALEDIFSAAMERRLTR